MADIYFNITGNGTAYAVPSSPTIGQTFDFNAIPDAGEQLVDVYCKDDNDQYVAVPVSTQFSMQMPNVMYLTFYVEFTGTTPPTPPTPTTPRKRKRMPIWMYPMFRK